MLDEIELVVSESVHQVGICVGVVHKVMRRIIVGCLVVNDAAAILPAVEGCCCRVVRFTVTAGRAVVIIGYNISAGEGVCFQILRSPIGKTLIGHAAAGRAVSVVANLIGDWRSRIIEKINRPRPSGDNRR